MTERTGAVGVKIDLLVRSHRRTIALEIAEDAGLIVRAPYGAPAGLVDRFVREKAAWIDKKQSAIRARRALAAPKRFVEGEEFLYLGRHYRLAFAEGAAAPLTFDGQFRLSTAHTHHPQLIFTGWYRREAYRVIGERLAVYAAMSGLACRSYRVTDARKRWGSCGPDDGLSFAWRLVLAPLDIVDYVVAHELAHVAEHNHSRRFWARVAAMRPDYRDSRQWLREHGHTLTV